MPVQRRTPGARDAPAKWLCRLLPVYSEGVTTALRVVKLTLRVVTSLRIMKLILGAMERSLGVMETDLPLLKTKLWAVETKLGNSQIHAD